MQPRLVNLAGIVHDLVAMLDRVLEDRVQVEFRAEAEAWILADPVQIEQVVLNLAVNARDAMPDGGRITIETANRWIDARMGRDRDLEPGQYVSLCVSDNGTGMPPEVVAKAFDPFFTTKPLGLGTGLGLSISLEDTHLHGGWLQAWGRPGEGAQFRLTLPRHLTNQLRHSPLPLVPDDARETA